MPSFPTAGRVPVALTIAGSDSGGGAGVQADLKTFEAHSVFGTSALTLITAQNTQQVSALHILPCSLIEAQIRAVFDDFAVVAVKTGALGSAQVVQTVAQVLQEYRQQGREFALVVDPVMLAKSGDALIEQSAVETLISRLFPLATLITPNLPEWQALEQAGASLKLPLLLKGGHGEQSTLVDELWLAGQCVLSLPAERQNTKHTHGTGCTYAAAITALLARGQTLPDAVQAAHRYLQAAIAQAPALGAGHGPLWHAAELCRTSTKQG